MFTRRRERKAFQKTKAAAADGAVMVCGTYGPDGDPRYFTMPKEATDAEIAERAFQVRYGRPQTEAELFLKRVIDEREPT